MHELVGAVLTRPVVDDDAARAILRDAWAVEGELRALPSERDRNWAVAVDGTDRYVLKVSNAAEDRSFLEMQHAAMRRLASAGVPCQLPVGTPNDEEIVSRGRSGAPPTLVRLLTWLPGRPLGLVPVGDRPEALLVDLGRTMGRTAAALAGFDHPSAHRAFQWEARRSLAVIDAHTEAVRDPARAALLGLWRRRLAPLDEVLGGLPAGVIHNDANDHNVLVADDGRSISGLLDLGDVVWSVVVNELAVAAAYAALDTPEPLPVIGAVRRGFEEARPLGDIERAVIVELVGLRLATSVALSAHQAGLDPDDPYLTISEAPAWDLLERLSAIEPRTAAAAVAP